MFRRSLIALACVTALTVGAPSSPAEAARKTSKTRKVKKYKKIAFKRFARGDYAGGIKYMEKAHALRPHPGFLLNIAVAYDRWGGHCSESLETFERFFTACDGCKLQAQARAKHAKIRDRCRVEVRLDTEPSGARLTVDGDPAGTAPITLQLEPGRHVVDTLRPGYEPLSTEIQVSESESEFTLPLVAIRVAAPPPPLPPVDPPPTEPPPPGLVTQPEPADAGTNLAPWTWTAFGVAAAGIGVGTWFTFQTMSALDSEEQARVERRTKREVEALQQDATNKAIVANVGFGVAAAGVLTGVLLLILDEDAPTETTLTPVIRPGGVGIAARF